MSAFDDILSLEEKAQDLERLLNRWRSTATAASRRLVDLRMELEKIDTRIKICRAHIHRMKHDYPVVLLSEYDRVINVLAGNERLREEHLADIARFTREGKEAEMEMKVLEAQLRQVKAQLASFNQVIQFRK
jgi:predicted  nucleic acid-binding Zn-ribbon protein